MLRLSCSHKNEQCARFVKFCNVSPSRRTTGRPLSRLTLIVSVTKSSGSRNEGGRSRPINSRCYAIRYPYGKTGRHGILRRFVPCFPCRSGGLIAHPSLVLVHAAPCAYVDRYSV